MVIVFIIDNYNSLTDGTAMSARRFCDRLEALGHEVRIVSFDEEGKSEFGLKEHKIPIVSYVSKKSNIIFAKYKKSVLKKALEGADIVHLFLPFQVQRKTMRLARKMKIPVSAAFHLHPENITKNAGVKKTPAILRSAIFWAWRKNMYEKVSHIHCPSQFIADEIFRHGYKSKKHIISNGVSDCFVPSKSRMIRNLSAAVPFDENNKFEILMTGRYANEKRQDLLIKAVKQSPYAKNIHITFAGMGPKEAKLKKLAQDLPCPATFAFFSQAELLEKIHTSDLYVHAADIEVEGISCIEAFSCGLVPVIGNARRSATKQFVIDERCTFTAGDHTTLSERINYWFTHPEELNKMSLRYIEYAKDFSLEAAVDKAVTMFKNTVSDDYFRYVPLLKEKKKMQRSMHHAFNKTLEPIDLLAQSSTDPFDPTPNSHLKDDPFILKPKEEQPSK